MLWEVYKQQHLAKAPPSSSASVLLFEFLLVTELFLFLLFPVLWKQGKHNQIIVMCVWLITHLVTYSVH